MACDHPKETSLDSLKFHLGEIKGYLSPFGFQSYFHLFFGGVIVFLIAPDEAETKFDLLTPLVTPDPERQLFCARQIEST